MFLQRDTLASKHLGETLKVMSHEGRAGSDHRAASLHTYWRATVKMGHRQRAGAHAEKSEPLATAGRTIRQGGCGKQ